MIGTLRFFKQHFGFAGSVIRVSVDDSSLYGETVQVAKNGTVVGQNTVKSTGTCDIITDESGQLTVSMPEKDLSVTFKVSYYGTYNIALNIHSDSGVDPGAGDDDSGDDSGGGGDDGDYDATTWAGLKKIVKAGQEKTYCNIGDEYPVELSTGESITYVIAAIDSSEDHQLIFCPKNYLGTERSFNVESSADVGWYNSSLRTWCNEGFYPTLPSEIRKVLSQRTWKTVKCKNEITVLQETTDYVFIPRYYELSGDSPIAAEATIPRINQWDYMKVSDNIKAFVSKMWTATPNTNSQYFILFASTSINNSNNYYWQSTTSYSQISTQNVLPCFQITNN